MKLLILVASTFIRLTGPDEQEVIVNTSQIVTVREPRDHTHFGPGVNCVLHMADGKFVGVVEHCKTVRDLMEAEPD